MDFKAKCNRLEDIIKDYRRRNRVELVNPLTMARGYNIVVNKTKLNVKVSNGKPVKGIYYYKDQKDYIYLDELTTSKEKRFIIAHELGHYFAQGLFKCEKVDDSIYDYTTGFESSSAENDEENEESLANFFAKELLLPQDLFSVAYRKCIESNNPINELSDQFGVEIELIKNRIDELGLSYV